MVKVKKWIPFSIIILLALIFGNRLNSLKRDALFFNGEKHYVLLSQYLSDLNTGMIKIDFSYQNKSQRTLFSTSSSSSNANNYSLNIADGLVQYYDRYNSVLVQSSTQLIPGVFYELLISYDNGKIEIFINGELQKLNITYQGNNKKIGWFSHVIKDNEAPIYTLGAFKRPSQVKNQFTGYIREFQIFNEGLNYGEVDYNAFKKNKYDKNLKINYQFDLSDFSTFSYYKTVVAGGFINLSQPKGLKIDFNETTKNTLQFHLFSFILFIILIILLTFFTKKESLFILPKNYIKGFDGLRGISILLVIITHLGWFENIDIFGSYDRKFKYLLSGTTGVNIFFTLSGFLITNILLNELNKYGTINFKTFFLKRFIRLLPPLFLFLVIIFILMLSNILTTNYSGILYSFFYIYNFIPRSLYSAELGLTWSLSVEEQFYLFWPISIFFIRRKKNLFVLLITIISICSIITIIHIIPYLSQLDFITKYISLSENYFIRRWTIPAIGTILMGCIAGILSKSEYVNNLVKANRKVVLSIAFLIMICFIYIPSRIILLGWIIQSIGTCILILYILNSQQSKIIKALEYKPLSAIGKISYGLYIYQGLFLTTGPQLEGPMFQKYPMNILLMLIFAITSYQYLEKPFLKLKSKIKSNH